MRVVVLRRQGAAPSEPDFPMATHAAVDASERRLVAGAVVLVEGRVIVLPQVIFLLVKRPWPISPHWPRRNDTPLPASRQLAKGQAVAPFNETPPGSQPGGLHNYDPV
jgi:hypothetical protein